MKGWVVKRGAVIKSWRRRWMSLKQAGGAIEYGLHPGKKAKGVIRLESTVRVKDTRGLLWSSEGDSVEWPSGARDTCFTIITPNRTYYLYCDTPGETAQWVQAISNVLQEMIEAEAGPLVGKNPDDPLPAIPLTQEDMPLPQLPTLLQSDMTDNERIEMWLSQTITRQDAERVLCDAPVGTFVLRGRIDNPHEYALSVSGPGGVVQHLKVQHSNECMVMPSGKQIDNLIDLLDHCRHTIDGLSVLLTIPTHAFDIEVDDEYSRQGGYASVEGLDDTNDDDDFPPRVGYDNLDSMNELRPQSFATDRSSTYSSAYEVPLDDPETNVQHYAAVETPEEVVTRRDNPRRPPPMYQNLSYSDPSGIALVNKKGRSRTGSEPESLDGEELGQLEAGDSVEDLLAPPGEDSNPSQHPSKEQLEREAKIERFVELVKPAELRPEQLEIIEIVGEGKFGTISEALLTTNGENGGDVSGSRLVAVKTLKATGSQTRVDFLNEAAVLKDCDHRNLLGFRGVIVAEEPWRLVVDFVTYGDLRQILKAFRTQNIPVFQGEKLFLAIQIASGMEYLASKQMIHRDLALSGRRNILLGENCEVKIGDFGLARKLGEDDEYHVVQHGSSMLPIRWMAPETFRERKFTTHSDVWAYGVVLWELMTLAKTPWRKLKARTIMVRVRNGERLEQPQDCTRQVYHMMKICWFEKPQDRPTFTELQEALTLMYEHDFDDNQQPPRNLGMLILE